VQDNGIRITLDGVERFDIGKTEVPFFIGFDDFADVNNVKRLFILIIFQEIVDDIIGGIFVAV